MSRLASILQDAMSRADLIAQAAGPMPPFVRELRDRIRTGDKTQTRRVIKPQPWDTKGHTVRELTGDLAVKYLEQDIWSFRERFPSPADGPVYTADRRCRYGQAGQLRYLREPLIKGDDGIARYRDDGVLALDADGKMVTWRWKKDILSQIFMPQTMARTFVRLDAIRAERLQEISQADALAEGIIIPEHKQGVVRLHGLAPVLRTSYSGEFALLWDKINSKLGYPWAGNWWVWVVVFRVIPTWPLTMLTASEYKEFCKLSEMERRELYFGKWETPPTNSPRFAVERKTGGEKGDAHDETGGWL